MNFITSAVNTLKPRLDDLGVDRFSYLYSTGMIMGMSVMLTAKQQVGSPLQCWVPKQFSKAWLQYAENYCFVYNTYWVHTNADIPDTIEERIGRQLIYYQWVPFIMALEALFFYIPSLIWGQLSTRSGLKIENLVKLAQEADQGEEATKQKKIAIIMNHFEDSVKLQKQRAEGATFTQHVLKLGLLDGTYISNVYLFIKFIYFMNIVGQFLMQNQFLGQYNHLWGATILSDIVSGTNWEDSGNFPRIAMCDFQVRTLGNLQRYSIQCVLSLNMFNEKIFLFLYWWFVAIGIATLFDMISLGYNTRSMVRRVAFVKKFIKTDSAEENYALEEFAETVTSDMVIILSMISNHSSDIVTTELLERLWNKYRTTRLDHVIRPIDLYDDNDSTVKSSANSSIINFNDTVRKRDPTYT